MDVFFVFQAFYLSVEEVEPFCGTENRACDEHVFVTPAAHVDYDCLVSRDFFCKLHCGGSCVGRFQGEEDSLVFCKERDSFKGVFVQN